MRSWAASLLFLAACQGTAPSEPGDSCGSAQHQGLIGQAPAAARGIPNARIHGVNDPVTRDYRPERLNVVHENGVIIRLSCG